MKERRAFARPALMTGLLLFSFFPPRARPFPQAQTAVLEYRLGERESAVTLSAGGLEWTAGLPAEALIEQSVAGFIREARRLTGNRRCLDRASARIAEELIPFRREITGIGATRLVVIPDGILLRLPFGALRFDGDWGRAFLAERLALAYRFSRGAPVARDVDSGGRGLLAIGAAGSSFDCLPAVGGELRRVARAFKGPRRCVSLDGASSEASFKTHRRESFEVIHIAAHGRSGRDMAGNGALVLLPGDGEDGYLVPDEIREAKLRAELVVLSACDTDGLTRSFMEAGARTVVSTLWPVSDRAAAEFMASFYSSLSAGLPKAEALREAKRATIQSGRAHPFFWAGYVLRGDPDGVISFR